MRTVILHQTAEFFADRVLETQRIRRRTSAPNRRTRSEAWEPASEFCRAWGNFRAAVGLYAGKFRGFLRNGPEETFSVLGAEKTFFVPRVDRGKWVRAGLLTSLIMTDFVFQFQRSFGGILARGVFWGGRQKRRGTSGRRKLLRGQRSREGGIVPWRVFWGGAQKSPLFQRPKKPKKCTETGQGRQRAGRPTPSPPAQWH